MASLLLRVIVAVPLLMMIILIAVSGFLVVEPVYNAAEDFQGAESVGWTTQNDVIMQFSALGLIGLVLVVVGWLIFGSLTSDVNQGRTEFRRF